MSGNVNGNVTNVGLDFNEVSSIIELVMLGFTILLNIFQSIKIHEINNVDLTCSDCCELIIKK